MAAENPSWGEARLADELLLKLGILVSPRTVGKIFVTASGSRARPAQRWLTFIRNHTQPIIECDFFVEVTARFLIRYILVVTELGTRKTLHQNGTAHPLAE